MIRIECSPLTVNQAWRGRRYKTSAYDKYEVEVSALLPHDIKNSAFEGLVEITYRFYLKHHATTDYDNLLKPLQDILCKNGVLKDDRFIYRAVIEKYSSTYNFVEIELKPLERDAKKPLTE